MAEVTEWEDIRIYHQNGNDPNPLQKIREASFGESSFEWNSRDGWRITCEHRPGSSCFRCRWRQARHLRWHGNSFRLSYSGLFRR